MIRMGKWCWVDKLMRGEYIKHWYKFFHSPKGKGVVDVDKLLESMVQKSLARAGVLKKREIICIKTWMDQRLFEEAIDVLKKREVKTTLGRKEAVFVLGEQKYALPIANSR